MGVVLWAFFLLGRVYGHGGTGALYKNSGRAGYFYNETPGRRGETTLTAGGYKWIEDIASGLDRQQWRALVGEFLVARRRWPEGKVN